MRIDAIRLTAYDDDDDTIFMELGLKSPDLTHRYLLQQAFGLDVDEVIPRFYGSFARQDFRYLLMDPREFALKIRLNPNHSLGEGPSELRDEIYKMIAYNRSGLMRIEFMLDDVVQAYINGVIKKVEATHFDSQPMSQITFECPNSFLLGPDDIELAGTPGVTVPAPILTDPYSTAPHGFKMILRFTANVPLEFTIQGKYGTTEAPFKIIRKSGFPFNNDDHLYFSSEVEDKYLYFVRGGVTTQLLDFIDLNQVWPMMFPGETQIGFSTSNVEILSITYVPHYWGV